VLISIYIYLIIRRFSVHGAETEKKLTQPPRPVKQEINKIITETMAFAKPLVNIFNVPDRRNDTGGIAEA